MKIPFFYITILITIFIMLLFVRSLDSGQGWAIVLSILGMALFVVLSILSLYYHMGQHKRKISALDHPDEAHH